MAKTYLWKNVVTGELIETDSWSTPPDREGKWQRAYAFGIGRVEKAGGSPARQVNQDE